MLYKKYKIKKMPDFILIKVVKIIPANFKTSNGKKRFFCNIIWKILLILFDNGVSSRLNL